MIGEEAAARAARELASTTLVEVSVVVPVEHATDDDQAIERAIALVADDLPGDLHNLDIQGRVVES